jgi:hypothetical protein
MSDVVAPVDGVPVEARPPRRCPGGPIGLTGTGTSTAPQIPCVLARDGWLNRAVSALLPGLEYPTRDSNPMPPPREGGVYPLIGSDFMTAGEAVGQSVGQYEGPSGAMPSARPRAV